MRLKEDLRRPKGFLPACLLLLLAEEPGHGYELADRLAAFAIDVSDPSHVYRALRAMELEDLVASTWTTGEPGPARRVYRITPEGEAALADCAAALDELGANLDFYLSRFHSLGAGAPRTRA